VIIFLFDIYVLKCSYDVIDIFIDEIMNLLILNDVMNGLILTFFIPIYKFIELEL